MRKLKVGDKIKVMRGKDAGKEGTIDKVVVKTSPKGQEKLMVVIKGVNVVKKHQKPNPAFNLPGGIIEIEKPIDASNVMLVDPKTGKPTRVGFRVDAKTGAKIRFAKKSGNQI
ncbi:50S ribosomal protein L24 [Candidatus Dojkabacteria bacterium]|uniref:Large ribosomal subunit protein uL24 n=1 Tax=Candidatus Dojkabacteria bacterium TaxID=2099670 RepID=A0A955I7A1_9BACT|nr:50S ribosomal protein L24 [Candidatus Dojkabacteria bacterium]